MKRAVERELEIIGEAINRILKVKKKEQESRINIGQEIKDTWMNWILILVC